MKTFTFFLLLLPVFNTASIHEFRSTSAAFFKEHLNITTYETSAKVVYKISLPLFDARDPGKCEGSDVKCLAELSVFRAKKELRIVFGDVTTSAPKVRRPKRQAVIAAAIGGFVLHSIYTTLCKKMFGTDADVETKIRHMKQSMEVSDNQLLLFRDDVLLYGQNVTRALNQSWLFDSTMEQQARSHLFLTQVYQYVNRLNFGMTRCSNNLVPFQFIQPATLQAKLSAIEKYSNQFGYHMAFHTTKLHELLQLKIADCTFTEGSVYVLLNIPLTKKPWKLFEMIPVPFAYSNQTCILESQHTDLVAVAKNDIKILDANSRQFCDIVHNNLCLIPLYQLPTEQSALCVSHVYRKSDTDDLGTACQIRCYPQRGSIVTYLDQNVVSVSSGNYVTVTCSNSTANFTLPLYGALEIALVCNCSYTIDSKLIETYGICFKKDFERTDIATTLPHFLVSPSLTGGPSDFANWTRVIPVLNYTYSAGTISKRPSLFDTDFEDSHRDIWLVILSCIAIILLTFGGITCCLFCRVFK